MIPIKDIDGTPIDITIPGQSGPMSSGNKWRLYIPQIPRVEPHHEIPFEVGNQNSLSIIFIHL